MAGKKVKTEIKMLIQAGSANPAPPVGSTLGPQGINLMQFCNEFNDKTATMSGAVPVVVTIYEDRSFEFVVKTPPVAELLKQTLNIKSGAGAPPKESVGSISKDKVIEIAQQKMQDLNAYDQLSAVKMVLGTCRSMGVKPEASLEEIAQELPPETA
jgi:large subunit ribosomal protein L11